jgi:hypothetical protein
MKEYKESFKEVHNKIISQMHNNKEVPQFPDFNMMVADLLKNEAFYGVYPRFGKYMKIFSKVSLSKK